MRLLVRVCAVGWGIISWFDIVFEISWRFINGYLVTLLHPRVRYCLRYIWHLTLLKLIHIDRNMGTEYPLHLPCPLGSLFTRAHEKVDIRERAFRTDSDTYFR